MGDFNKKINSFLKNKYYIGIFLFILLLVLKFPILNTPYFDDEKLWYVSASLLISQNNLNPIYRGIELPKELQIEEERKHPWFDSTRNYITDGVHPPLFFEILALFYLLFGHSLILTHIIVIIISFLILQYTYLLGKYLFNSKTGFFASILLLFSPVFFSQAGRAYPDILCAWLGLATIYYALKNNKTLYLIFGSLTVLSRETGICFIIIILIYKIDRNFKNSKKIIFNTMLQYGFPILIILFWYVYHYIKTGLFIYGQNVSRATGSIQFILNFLEFTKFIFIEQYRFILTIIMIYFMIKNKNKLTVNKLIPLITVLCLIIFISWANVQAIRHLTPIFPFLFIFMTFSLEQTFKKNKKLLPVIVFLIIILSIKEWHAPTNIIYEENMHYLDVINTREIALDFILKNYPNSTFWVDGLFYYDLVYPYNGYVQEPLTNVELIPIDYLHKNEIFYNDSNFNKNFKKGDLVLDSKWAVDEIRKEYEFIRYLDLELIKEINVHNEFIKIYKIK